LLSIYNFILSENRRIATGDEKPADSYRAMILLGFIRIWLTNLLSYPPSSSPNLPPQREKT